MTKAKGLPPTRLAQLMRILKWGMALVVVCGCGGLALMIAFLSIGTVEAAPNPTLMLTAESLYVHPLPTVEGVLINSRALDDGNRICYGEAYAVGDDGQPLPPRHVVSKTNFTINGSRVPPYNCKLALQSA